MKRIDELQEEIDSLNKYIEELKEEYANSYDDYKHVEYSNENLVDTMVEIEDIETENKQELSSLLKCIEEAYFALRRFKPQKAFDILEKKVCYSKEQEEKWVYTLR